MEQVGVEAVVKGLTAFLGDMGSIQGAINSLTPSSNLVTNVLDSLGNALGWLGQQVLNIAEYAIGGLLKDAIEGAIQLIRDMTGAAIEAGEEFQSLTIHLNGINLNDLIGSYENYNDAVAASIALTREQLDWIQLLAVTTPFDVTDVANVYAMARAFGFGDEEARALTISISDFAAGMGLGNEELERIIVNFGQMIQRGKITTREMNDLARGSLVPLADILERVAENMGISTGELQDLISTADGVPAEEFIKAFEEMTSEEERFAGASARMAHTFKGALDNMKDLISSFGGRQIMQPILDLLGAWIGGFLDLFAVLDDTGPHFTKLGEQLKAAASAIGAQIVSILSQIFGVLPSPEDLAAGLVKGLQDLAAWIGEHREDIIDFFVNIVDTIKNDVIPFIVNKLIPAFAAFIGWLTEHSPDILFFFETVGNIIADHVMPFFNDLGKWIGDNQPLLDDFFNAILNIIRMVIENLTGQSSEGGSILDTVKSVMEWIVDHQEGIATAISNFIKLWVIIQVVAFVIKVLVGAIIGLISFFFTLGTTLAALGVYFLLFSDGIAVSFIDSFDRIKESLAGVTDKFVDFGQKAGTAWDDMVENIREGGAKAIEETTAWWDANKEGFAEFWEVIKGGFIEFWEFLKDSAVEAWEKIKGAFVEAWENIKQNVVDAWNFVVEKTREFWTNFKTILSELWVIIQYYWTNFWRFILTKASEIWADVTLKFTQIRDTILQKVQEAVYGILHIDWDGIGWSIIQGMIDGVLQGAAGLIDAIVTVAINAYNAALAAIGAGSPSRLFMDWGKFTMQGMAVGLERYSGLVVGTMQNAIAKIAAPAMALPAITQSITAMPASSASNYSSNNTYNLNVNSSASTEPIISDFTMLQSLAGG